MPTVHNDKCKTLVILSTCLNSNYRKVITKLSTFVCHEYMNICLKGEFNNHKTRKTDYNLHVHVFSFGIFFIYIHVHVHIQMYWKSYKNCTEP